MSRRRRAAVLRPARLRPADIVRLGGTGLRTRPLRVFLSALGIAIGVAAMVAVVGISSSSRAEVDRKLDQLGTNMLRVAPGQTPEGETTRLPKEAVPMIGRIGPVQQVTATGTVKGAAVYRNEHVPVGRTSSVEVAAAGSHLLPAIGGKVRTGRWLESATEEYPAVVLGAQAARRLDVCTPGTRLWLGGKWFSLVGVLEPMPLAPEVDSSALVGWQAAQTYLGFDGHPSTVYVRARDDKVAAVRGVLAATANPEKPSGVLVSRPSDALAARKATESALTGLLLGLGGVALLVGGVGVVSAWATRWSSRCSNAARRSVCAGLSAPPVARSGASSSPNRCCCPHWADSAERSSARPSPPGTHTYGNGRPRYRCGRPLPGSPSRC